MRSRLNSFFSSYLLVLAIAKAMVIAIASKPTNKSMELKRIVVGVWQ
jgi:hypothetical protein